MSGSLVVWAVGVRAGVPSTVLGVGMRTAMRTRVTLTKTRGGTTGTATATVVVVVVITVSRGCAVSRRGGATTLGGTGSGVRVGRACYVEVVTWGVGGLRLLFFMMGCGGGMGVTRLGRGGCGGTGEGAEGE